MFLSAGGGEPFYGRFGGVSLEDAVKGVHNDDTFECALVLPPALSSRFRRPPAKDLAPSLAVLHCRRYVEYGGMTVERPVEDFLLGQWGASRHRQSARLQTNTHTPLKTRLLIHLSTPLVFEGAALVEWTPGPPICIGNASRFGQVRFVQGALETPCGLPD